MNVRNTKSQYTKQLRNFLKVSILSYQTKLTNTVQKTDSIKGFCRPMEMGGNGCWKLGVQDPEDSEIEEVVLRVQGVVCNRELPPIRKPFKVYVLIEIPVVVNKILTPSQRTQQASISKAVLDAIRSLAAKVQ